MIFWRGTVYWYVTLEVIVIILERELSQKEGKRYNKFYSDYLVKLVLLKLQEWMAGIILKKEAANACVLKKNVFSKISQISQENISFGVSF